MRDRGDSREPHDQLDRDELRARLNFPPSLDGPLRPPKRGPVPFPADPLAPVDVTSDVLFKLDDLATQVEKLTDRIEEIGAPQTEAILDALRAQSISQTAAILGEFRAQMTAQASLFLEELRAQVAAQGAALVEQLRKRSVSETDAVTEELRALSAESTAAIVHELRDIAARLEANLARPNATSVTPPQPSGTRPRLSETGSWRARSSACSRSCSR